MDGFFAARFERAGFFPEADTQQRRVAPVDLAQIPKQLAKARHSFWRALFRKLRRFALRQD
jgi:hypothetical protein